MKLLWVKSDLLHPTTKGGHIRTLEILKRLHARNEVHYVGFENDPGGEGVRRSVEYCSKVYPVPHRLPSRSSPAFAAQLVQGLFSGYPVAILRYQSQAMAKLLAELIARERFDSIVCDFVTPAPNLPALSSCVVFQHNVETMIWQRHAQNATNAAKRWYFSLQARRMKAFEAKVCRAARHVIAVSAEDARTMRDLFGVEEVTPIATGVDVEYFTPPPEERVQSGLVFVGSMDWLPNIDGMRYFCEVALPLVRRVRPDCTVSIVGRSPTREIRALMERDPLIRVTGTVPDVRPYLWESAVSIVPLRIGGGTRMKIYEAMAAKTAVVSTTVGAEGLEVHPPCDIRIADTPQAFAAACVELLADREKRVRQADAAWRLVAENFGWEQIASQFENILLLSSNSSHVQAAG